MWAGYVLLLGLLAGLSSCGGCGDETLVTKRGTEQGKGREVAGVSETSYVRGFFPGETSFGEGGLTIPDIMRTPIPTVTPVPSVLLPREQRIQLDAQTLGDASVGMLGNPLLGAAGIFTGAHAGDYVLKNSRVEFYFSAIKPRKEGERLEVPLHFTNRRHPGALLDVATPQSRVDFMWEFTQALGTEAVGPVIEYDSAEFLTRTGAGANVAGAPDATPRPQSVGIRLTGSAMLKEQEVRVETTYWLAPRESRMEIETRILEGDLEAPITDYGNWGAAPIIVDRSGAASSQGRNMDGIQWYAAHAGDLNTGVAVPDGRLEGYFARNTTRVQGYREAEGKREPVRRRWFYVGSGNYSGVTDQILRDMGTFGMFRGSIVHKETAQRAPDAWVDVLYYDRTVGPGSRVLFTRINPDAGGNFTAILPTWPKETSPQGQPPQDRSEDVNATPQPTPSGPRPPEGYYFAATGGRSRAGGMSSQGILVRQGHVTEKEMYVSEAAMLTVKVVDSKTSRPLAARIRFEPIPPSPGSQFEVIDSAAGYANSFYVPPEGKTVSMNQGLYTLTASSGIRYNLSEVDIETQHGLETTAHIELDEVSPTPGWLGLNIGAMSRATPGVALTAEDAVLMSAGEGLDWIISGDLDVITDLSPIVARMGLSDRMGVSRGFRTYLPRRSEWGEFLIFPVAGNAPDPRLAREQWKDLASDAEFFETLRRLYPGALIEAVTPYSDNTGMATTGQGYFFVPKWNVYQMTYSDNERPEKRSFGVDLANVFPSNKVWYYLWEKDFYFINALRNRFIIPAPVNPARVAFLSEPGYPRLLVRTDQSDPRQVREEDLFGALRKGRWQVTSGPFIDFKVDGRREGEMYNPGKKIRGKLRITAPSWARTTHIELLTDGAMRWKESDSANLQNENLRFQWDGEAEMYPELKDNADTMVSVGIVSELPIDSVYRSPAGGMQPLALNGPVFVDTNSNEQWDPPSYINHGK